MWRALLISPPIVSLYHVCWQLCVAKHTKCIRASLDHVMNVPKQGIGKELHISLLHYCPLASSCHGLKYSIHLVNRLLGQLFLADVSQNTTEMLQDCTALWQHIDLVGRLFVGDRCESLIPCAQDLT